MIPVRLIRLPAELVQLYLAIRSFDWERKGKERTGCSASVPTLAEIVGKAVRQTRANLHRLEACRAVRREEQVGVGLRLFCTPEVCDPALLPLRSIAPVRPSAPLRLTAETPAVDCREPLRSTAPKVDTGSRSRSRNTQRAELPGWMPAATWEAWKAHRRAKKAPLTAHAEALCLRKLEKWRGEGHDAVALVELAIERGWQGLFLPTDQQRSRAPVRLGDDEARKLFDEGTDR